jgi:hypothetical protein
MEKCYAFVTIVLFFCGSASGLPYEMCRKKGGELAVKKIYFVLFAALVVLGTGCSTTHPKVRVSPQSHTILFEGSY